MKSSGTRLSIQRTKDIRWLVDHMAPAAVYTQEQVGKLLGISQQRVDQIERGALWKVRMRLLESTGDKL